MLWGLPSALWLLAGAVPLILFLHSLKPRGARVASATLFIWERVINERPLAARLSWLLRKNLLLILQLLAAIALILALADPGLLHFGAPAGDTVAVIDLTASMKAKDEAGSRFDAARRELLSLVDRLPAGRKMMVIGAGPETRLIVPFSADRKRLREAVRSLRPSDAPGRVKDAILFAHGFLKKGSPDRVVAISDGAFEGAEEFTRETSYFRFIKVGAGTENTAIVGFDVRRQPGGAEHYQALVRVRNFGDRPVTPSLRLTLGESVIARQNLELPGLSEQVLVYSLDASAAGILTASLDFDDDLATDNRAVLSLAGAAPLRILYVGPGNPVLINLLALFPQVQLTEMAQWAEMVAEIEGTGPGLRIAEYDVAIFDRVTPPALSAGNIILINTLAANVPVHAAGEPRAPRGSLSVAKHPVTANLSLADLHVHEALHVGAGPGVDILARAANQPLLAAYERAQLRVLFIAFDLMATDLPFRVAFPVLFHNTFEWFRPARREFPADAVRAGAPVTIFLPAAAGELAITTPSGKNELVRVAANPLVFNQTLEAGIYTYTTAGRQGRFAVNLLDEDESNIAPRTGTVAAAVETATEAPGGAEEALSLWPMLLLGVLLLLASEVMFAYRLRLGTPALALRVFALAMLVLSLINPKLFRTGEALDVVVGVDLSRSVGQEAWEKARELLEAAARVAKPDSRTGLLAFGGAPEWEYPPREEFFLPDTAPRIDREQTDIQAALQAGMAQVGEARQGKFLLLSDGNENRGASARMIPLLRSQGMQVWTLPVSFAARGNEVFVSDLTVPHQVDSGETFDVSAKVESVGRATARVRLLRDGNLAAERELKLEPGANDVKFRDNLRERGSHTYELLVQASDDTLAENNVLQGVVEVKGPPRVLLVSGQPDAQRFIGRALAAQGFAVVESAADAGTLSLAGLSAFDLLILDNVPAFQLSHAKMESIEQYVRDLGGGLVVIGGAQSYGAGGYFRTPLERVLPLEMRPPARLDLPHVALLFVLDKSGSMGAGAEGSTKLDLAKAAAIAAADIMNPNDQIGILAFDAAWEWALPFRPVGKGEWINDKLAALQSDGGTDLHKALVEARRAMLDKAAAIKHVIVLSDGLTDKADFQSLIRDLARAETTVSTVSVGNDADVKLMAEIAREGKGRGYVALDPQTIPQIFTTETLLIARDLLIEKSFTPGIVARVGPLRGIAPAGAPPLHGYVLTYPKQRAEMLMKAGDDPLLATWRHGLGRVTAFTSDLSGRWGKDWVAWQSLPQWAGQIARDAMRRVVETRTRAAFQKEGDAVKVVADVVASDGAFTNHLPLRGNIAAAGQATQQLEFHQTAPGRYEARFTPTQRGIHYLTLSTDSNAEQTPSFLATVPYVAPFPEEYRALRPNYGLLSRLAEETGGEMLDGTNAVAALQRLYTAAPGKASDARETWWPLAAVALALFLGDLAVRTWRPHSHLRELEIR
jgi:Mg-chelatase subunit ChlD